MDEAGPLAERESLDSKPVGIGGNFAPPLPANEKKHHTAWGRRVLAALAILLALLSGLNLRHWTWQHTGTIRFSADLANAYKWGSRASTEGVVHVYEHVEAEKRDSAASDAPPSYDLDYPPLRLAIAAWWVRTVTTDSRWPATAGWQRSYAFNSPMLALNTISGLFGAIGTYVLIRLWYIRGFPTQNKSAAEVRALTGALLFWFNPAVICDGYGWPQWDIWLWPFFLFAALLASVDRWLAAGILIATGAMIKGQILLVAPIFVLWPLIRLKLRAVFQFLAGFIFGAALITAPWSIQNKSAVLWILRAAVACGLPLLARITFPKRARLATAVAIIFGAVLVVSPLIRGGALWFACGMLLFVMIGILTAVVPRRDLPSIFSALASIVIFLCVPFYHGTAAWLAIGFGYGARKFEKLIGGTTGVVNLGSLLQHQWGWTYKSTVPLHFSAFGVSAISISGLMIGMYLVALALASLALAIQDRRGDVRFLVALCVPWLAMYALLPQMHSRYLLWAAAATATMTAVSLGLTLLHLLITLTATSTILAAMAAVRQNSPPQWLLTAIAGNDGLAWVVLLCAAMFLYLAFLPSPPLLQHRG